MMQHGIHHLSTGLRAPGYWEWLRELSAPDLAILYGHYRLQVQHLQLHFQDRRWTSKTMAHALFFPVLFQVFPDARVIRLHRDPCQIVPAQASLAAHMRIIYTERVDFVELGQLMLEFFVDAMHRSIEVEKTVGAEHFIDIMFDDLVGDPIRTIQNIYEKFGFGYTGEFDTAIRRHLAAESPTRKYKHVYSMEQFGLSRQQILNRSAEYLSWLEERVGSL